MLRIFLEEINHFNQLYLLNLQALSLTGVQEQLDHWEGETRFPISLNPSLTCVVLNLSNWFWRSMENYKENENHAKNKNIPLDLEIPVICCFKAISKILTHKHIHQKQFLRHSNSHSFFKFQKNWRKQVHNIVLCHLVTLIIIFIF